MQKALFNIESANSMTKREVSDLLHDDFVGNVLD